MKKLKNAMLFTIGGLAFATIAITSCSKSSSPAPSSPSVSSFTSNFDTAGATVKVYGAHLTGTSIVTVGGTAATYSVVADTEVDLHVPAGAGASGIISVTTPGGTTTKSGFHLVDVLANSNAVAPNSSLIAYWPFDNSLNESKSSSAPTLTGGTNSFVPGKIGEAVYLNQGWLTYPSTSTPVGADNSGHGWNSNDTLQTGFTLSLWAQVSDTSLLTNLFQLSTPAITNWPILGLAYRKHSNNTFDFDAGLTNVDGTGPHASFQYAFKEPAFTDSLSWALLTLVFDASTKTYYYYANGALVYTVFLPGLSTDSPFPDPTTALLMITPNYPTIGTFESTATTPGGSGTIPAPPAVGAYMSAGITGKIDDVRLYNINLTAKQVADLFYYGNKGL